MSDTKNKSYGQALKSSALIGGSLSMNVGLSIVRTKVMAVLLGTAGFGLFGVYWSISELIRSIAGMGINTSGVRQIAEAVGTGDSRRIARTVTTLRRVALVLGGAGGLFLVVFCRFISEISFKDEKHAGSIALLGLAVLFGEISAAQGALIQGMRRIGDLARFNLLGGIYGTLSSIAIVYFFYRRGEAERGVVPSLVCLAATNILMSWWYARKVKVDRVALSAPEIRAEASGLLNLGVAFMISGLMSTGAAYLIRIMVLHRAGAQEIGLQEAGCYSAAWSVGGIYVNFILQAMTADFFPRLSAVAGDNQECNRLVNEQAEVGLLIAGPGMLGILSFSPVIVWLFYASGFEPAAEVLRWFCLGMVLRVMAWSVGAIFIAKGLRNLFLGTEIGINVIYIGLSWAGVRLFGLPGTGMAFFGMYVIYLIGVYMIVRRTSGFRWSRENRKLALVFIPLFALVFGSSYFLSPIAVMILGAVVTTLVGIYSLRILCRLVPLEQLPRPVQKVLKLFRLGRPSGPVKPLDETLVQKVGIK